MKILLLGNYLHSRQQSMQRFADLMRELLTAVGTRSLWSFRHSRHQGHGVRIPLPG
jgi:hypothetical protein